MGIRHKFRGVETLAMAAAIIAVAFMAAPKASMATEATWSAPVSIASGTYNSLAIAVTDSNMYLGSWEYGTWANGNVYVFSSGDGGLSWTKTDVFGSPVKDAHPNMCAYTTSTGNDVVLVASCPGMVARSVDGGATFQRLTNLPMGNPEVVGGQLLYPVNWIYMSIGTRASWNGGVPDSDIFVIGARVFGDYWSGLLYLSMTVSHDDGLTWEDPWTIVPTLSYYPEVTSDGQSLFAVFDSLVMDSGYASLYAMRSDDWGVTWTAPVLIYTRTYLDGGCDPCSLQDLGDGTALLAASDHRPIYSDNYGMWGVLRYSDMLFTRCGMVAGPEWNTDLGFAGKMMPDQRMALGWLFFNYATYKTEVRFTYGSNVGVPLAEVDVVQKIESMMASITGWTLSPSVKKGLLAKLQETLTLIDNENMNGAVHKMIDFVNMVDAQRGKALSTERADYLTSEANVVIAAL